MLYLWLKIYSLNIKESLLFYLQIDFCYHSLLFREILERQVFKSTQKCKGNSQIGLLYYIYFASLMKDGDRSVCVSPSCAACRARCRSGVASLDVGLRCLTTGNMLTTSSSTNTGFCRDSNEYSLNCTWRQEDRQTEERRGCSKAVRFTPSGNFRVWALEGSV